MFNTEKNEKIYIYDIYTEKFTCSFNNMDEVIDYLAHSMKMHFMWNGPKLDFDDINVTGNDLVRSIDWDSFASSYRLRRYMYVDAYRRTIDIAQYADAIKKRYAEKELEEIKKKKEQEEFWESLSHGDLLERRYWYSRETIPYRFRYDPVPGIHHKTHGYGIYLRHVRTTAELRSNEDVEYKDFVRAKRRKLPTLYDDIPKGYQRSWKRQSKKRKQWM